MSPLIFDIETGPESDEVLAVMEPEFSAPSNYKDPAKIAQNIEEQRESWRARAALCATTGRVLAIGMMDAEIGIRLLTPDNSEAELISEFWKAAAPDGKLRYLVGFNSNRFDIPFLVRRSYKLGVRVPYGVTNGRYLNPRFVDIMDAWKVGDYQASISLDRLAAHLGCRRKNGDGAHFAELYESDPDAALNYLQNDILMTHEVAVKLGVVEMPTTAGGDY
jgi:predicted PolB exonuclease-like 3'-5' exonuclease